MMKHAKRQHLPLHQSITRNQREKSARV